MNDWRTDDFHDDDAPLLRSAHRGKMPVGSEARASAASKATWRSRKATKRIARASSGIRNRRNRKFLV